MRALLLTALAVAALAQEPRDPAIRLLRARQILTERNKRLPDYTCVQTVDRRYLKPRKAHRAAPSCDEVRARRPDELILEKTDRLRLEIKASQGEEIGSWNGSPFNSRDIFELVGGGPYGTGALGGLIWDVFINGGATYKYIGEETSAGAHLASYSYAVPLAASHYRLKSGSNWATVPFAGVFWLDADSFDLQRLTEQATELPPDTGGCEIDTTIDYQKVKVGVTEFLLPRQSSMRQAMQDESETQSTAVYSGCREYRGESTIRFDQVPAPDEPGRGVMPQPPLPAGLPFTLALTAPIDTDIAAAGDIVRAKLRNPVRDAQSKAVLAPAGTVVQGRIVHLEHSIETPRHFTISIVLEKLETGGVPQPLYAKPIRHYREMLTSGPVEIPLPPDAKSPFAAAFAFRTDKDRYLVPAGYQSDWMTVSLPSEEQK